MSEPSNFQDVRPVLAIAVIGAKGLLGSALMRYLNAVPGFDAVGLDCDECDIADSQSILQSLYRARPDIVINCAAFTQVDACETQAELAFRVNGEGAGNVASAARVVGTRLVHISTDYVFDGSATKPIGVDAQPGPPDVLSAYGRSKLEGERRVFSANENAVIVRTAWLYGQGDAGFPNAILKQACESGGLRVVDDQTGSPTYADDLAVALVRVAVSNVCGLLHVTNSGQCTWYEFACEILQQAGLADVPIEPVPTSAFPRPARRPAFSVLDNSRFVGEIGPTLRHWRDALADYVHWTSKSRLQ